MKLRIAEIRKAKGLTQTALSRLCGVAREQINRYERGKVIPETASLERIAQGLGCEVKDLIADA